MTVASETKRCFAISLFVAPPATASAPAPAATAPLTVTVREADGTPVADRPVSIVVPGQLDPVASGTTGADGSVTFEGLDPAVDYTLVDEVTGIARGPALPAIVTVSASASARRPASASASRCSTR